MEKQKPYRFHIGFNEDDEEQVKVAKILNEVGRRNIVPYLTKAVVFYATAKSAWDTLTPTEIVEAETKKKDTKPTSSKKEKTSSKLSGKKESSASDSAHGIDDSALELLSQSMRLFDG